MLLSTLKLLVASGTLIEKSRCHMRIVKRKTKRNSQEVKIAGNEPKDKSLFALAESKVFKDSRSSTYGKNCIGWYMR